MAVQEFRSCYSLWEITDRKVEELRSLIQCPHAYEICAFASALRGIEVWTEHWCAFNWNDSVQLRKKEKKKKGCVCAHVTNLYSWWDRHSNRSLAVKCGSMEAIWNTEQVFYFVCLFFFLHPTYTPLNRTLVVRVTNTPALWNWLFRY